MTPVINNWGSRDNPILTLVSETWDQYPEWTKGPTSKTFSGGIHNVLTLPFVFKYKKPYGGDASYWIAIDRGVGSIWHRVHYKEAHFYSNDKEWHSEYQEFDLSLKDYSIFWHDTRLHFRIYGGIEGGGNLATGSAPGSLGSWHEFEGREFTAIFEKLDYQLGEPQLISIEHNFQDWISDCREKAKSAAKSERTKKPEVFKAH